MIGAGFALDATSWQAWWPPGWLMALTAVVAVICVLYDGIWRYARNLVTIVHEGGHALVALLTGRRLTAIRLHSDTSGLTVSSGKPYGGGMIATGAAGYLAPPVVGMLIALLVRGGQGTLVLWLGAVALLTMLVMVRNAYGIVTVVISTLAVLVLSFLTPPGVHAAIVATLAWFLLFAGPRTLVELNRHRKQFQLQHGGGDRRGYGAQPRSDADQLADLTGLSPTIWMIIFSAGVFITLLLGAAALGTSITG